MCKRQTRKSEQEANEDRRGGEARKGMYCVCANT